MNENKLNLLRMLVNDGDEVALQELADYYYFKTNKQTLSFQVRQEGLNVYHQLAETGNAHDMATLGVIYYEGLIL
ncbi:hypothetical protein Q5O24_06515 [Eubacteriaceae bacterium ES3]|nr:hypothetical protein Q5O24_06515 [Eubacteriaceae bacterium ES3]